jgi:predicted transcriptional regulator
MDENRICTIEINLNDNFANACAYHVDYLEQTVKRNLLAASESHEMNNWALIGLANSLDEACSECEKLRQLLCKVHGKKSYGIEEILEKMGQEQEDEQNQILETLDEDLKEFRKKIKEKFDLTVNIVFPDSYINNEIN